MLKNVQDAKFAKTLQPISKVVLRPGDQSDLSFEPSSPTSSFTS